jgi:putative N6-adenine-specific DNA methylase
MEQNNTKFELVATTAYGLEQILADELLLIGAEDIEILTRAVSFIGTKEIMYRANLEIRTALRILKPIYSFRAKSEIELYRGVKEVKWETYLNPDRTFAMNSAVHSDYFNHENYVSLKSKDAIVDQLRTTFGTRPNIDVVNPDLRINIHISGDRCNVLLDSSGNSLHKRGYRIGQGLAPINEVLAAGMILLTGWKGDSDFIDPMCGSGTFLMEAATIAYNIAPGIKIAEFGFMKWDDYEPELWERIKANAKRREKDFHHKIIGFDESPKAIRITKENVKNAELGWKILLRIKTLEDIIPSDLTDGGTVMINPPYGERMSENDINSLYETIGDCLKQNFEGYSVWIISSNKDAMKNIGLRTSKKLTLYNGSLECKFHNFQIYKGSKKSKYLTNESNEII